MGALQKRFLLINLGVTLFGYLIVFGDSGILNRMDLQNRLKGLHQTIQDLKQENSLLHERYIALKEGADGTGADQDQPDPPVRLGNGTTIIKFDEIPDEDTMQEQEGPGRDRIATTVLRGRTLFLMGMLFITVAGTTLLHYYGQEEKHS